MNREKAIEYVGHHVDNALSPDIKPITDSTRLVGWQCGFEPMFVAVHCYMGMEIDDNEAVDLASDLLCGIDWFSDGQTNPDFVI